MAGKQLAQQFRCECVSFFFETSSIKMNTFSNCNILIPYRTNLKKILLIFKMSEYLEKNYYHVIAEASINKRFFLIPKAKLFC